MDPRSKLYRDPRKQHNVVRLSNRIVRDESVFNDFVKGVPVHQLVEQYDLSKTAVRKAVHRHAIHSGELVPPFDELTERRRLYRIDRLRRDELETLRMMDLDDMDEKSRKHYSTKILHREIYFAWRKGKSFTWLSGRYSLPQVSIKYIIRMMSKRRH